MIGGDRISLRRILSVLGMMPFLACGSEGVPSGDPSKYYYVVQAGSIISYEDGRVFRIYLDDNGFQKEEL